MSYKRRHRRNFQRPSSSPANIEPSHFLKIILPPSIHAQNMRIPNELVRRFEDELSTSEAMICVPDGRVWKMEMNKSENDVWLCKGWEEFFKYYSLSFGFFLVFNYEGNSKFSVVIFDSSAAEIHYPVKLKPQKQNSVVTKCSRKRPYRFDHCGYKTRSKRQRLEDEEEIIDIEDENALEDGKSGNGDRNGEEEIDDSSKHEKEKNRCGQGLYSRIRKRASMKRQRAVKTAQNIKPSKPPSFTAIVRPTNLQRCYLDVPGLFWKEHMGKMCPMKLEDSEGRRWKVNYGKRASSIRIGKGWIGFARANNVKEGDKCVFELIKWNRNFVIQVTISA